MPSYYNEFDPYAAAWLRNLIAAGHIAPGDVDERSIAEVKPDDLKGYTQCHFFAGIGGWILALRLADWDDARPVWTGSCPCQPFSAAGKQRGTADERHLWPEFRRLIAECRPTKTLGEQVASRLGREWLAGVRTDLEALGYAVGAADLCAASIGAPHIRQRLWWVADADQGQRGRFADGEGRERDGHAAGRQQGDGIAQSDRTAGRLADPNGGLSRHGNLQPGREHGQQQEDGDARGLDDAERERGRGGSSGCEHAGDARQPGKAGWGGHVIGCADGKARRVESTIFPLAHAGEWGPGSRVGILRGAGNAIVPQVAAAFIRASM
jgi:DNA (cytosine-5)-methyltransferase 1